MLRSSCARGEARARLLCPPPRWMVIGASPVALAKPEVTETLGRFFTLPGVVAQLFLRG